MLFWNDLLVINLVCLQLGRDQLFKNLVWTLFESKLGITSCDGVHLRVRRRLLLDRELLVSDDYTANARRRAANCKLWQYDRVGLLVRCCHANPLGQLSLAHV